MQALRGLASSFRTPLTARRRSQRCALPPSAARRSQHKRANSIVAQSTALTHAAVPGLHACAPEPRSSTQELIERILAEREPKKYDW
jgi:hypothetical protein